MVLFGQLAAHVEDAHLCRPGVVLAADGPAHQLVEVGGRRFGSVGLVEILCAVHVAHAVEGTGFYQHLHVFLVHGVHIDALQEVEDVLVGTVLLALSDDYRRGGFAHAADGLHAEAYLAVAVDAEVELRLVDAWRGHLDALLPAVVHKLAHTADVGLCRGHHGSHIFGRVMGFEVGCLVSHPRIASRVALVEGVGGELLPFLPYLGEGLLGVAVFLAAFIEEHLQLIHLVNLFLAHGLAQGVTLAASEARQQAAQEHDLLLVHGDAVGVFEVFLHHWQVVLDGFAALLAVDEFGYIVHGTRSVEGVHGYEVVDDMRLQLPQVFLHAGTFKLEHADGVALAE